MEKPLKDVPVFVETEFQQKIAPWKAVGIREGHRIVIEWVTVGTTGPHVFVYPADHRDLGIQMLQRISQGRMDERWADYLEFEYLPKIAAYLTEHKYHPQVICVDLRPLQVQRERRRAIAAVARAKTGAH